MRRLSIYRSIDGMGVNDRGRSTVKQCLTHEICTLGINSAGAAFDVEGIAQALKEDTSKKYSDEGLGLVETLKKRYACLAWGRYWDGWTRGIKGWVGPVRNDGGWSIVVIIITPLTRAPPPGRQERAEQGEERPRDNGEDLSQ